MEAIIDYHIVYLVASTFRVIYILRVFKNDIASRN